VLQGHGREDIHATQTLGYLSRKKACAQEELGVGKLMGPPKPTRPGPDQSQLHSLKSYETDQRRMSSGRDPLVIDFEIKQGRAAHVVTDLNLPQMIPFLRTITMHPL